MQAYPPNHYPSLNYSSSSSLVIWIKKSKQKLFLSSKEERLEKKRKKNCQKSNYYCDFFCIHPAPDDSVQKDLKFDKKCKRNCDNPKKQNKHRKSECPHAPVTSLSSGSSKGMWTLWYQKKINLLNTSASARSSLRAKKRGRAACVYPAKFSKNIVIVIFPNLQNRSEVPLHIVLPSTHPRIIHSAYSCQVVKELLLLSLVWERLLRLSFQREFFFHEQR